ncbi:hypothetical protein PIROE2DRAFT_14285 [Piromyces sp. E2]|nr:hypothetical protein PIROE2DRAFT_14285 [Piromyces sp. E2]|eukprot:OUM60031.1 hypothetical protein PIROE2DRAFT_14285 [Piromyces sp. E2]
MDKKIELDLINCTAEQCRQFAEQILNDEFEIEEIRKYFDNYINRDDYSREDAVIIIRNLLIIRQNINKTKVEYIYYSDKLLLKVSKYIEKDESVTVKILYGLFLSVIDKEHGHNILRDDSAIEVIDNIYMRFYFFNKDEKEGAYFIREQFKELIKKSDKYKNYTF